MSGAEGADSGGDGNNIVWFLYTGQDSSEIPRDVTHARIDPSVKEIDDSAFNGCEQLVEVQLSEGLEIIGYAAFAACKSLERFIVPSTVREIVAEAFSECSQLEEVELCEGLQKIGDWAFCGCKSLNRFKVPSTVKVISVGHSIVASNWQRWSYVKDLKKLEAGHSVAANL